MFNTDFVYFYFKTWDQTEATEQTSQDDQVINLDLPSESADQAWPCHCPYMVS